MKVLPTAIADVLVLEPRVFGDARGWLSESFNRREFRDATGLVPEFVQDNHSHSARGVLRGLHYQARQPQAKLVRVARGAVYDVAVDVRRSSPTLGQWVAAELSEENHRQMWLPAGFAHGFFVLSESADLLYKATDYYAPGDEHCIAWDDPDLAIAWPEGLTPVLSERDRRGGAFRTATLSD